MHKIDAYVYRKKIDWQEIIRDLNRAGKRNSDLCLLLGQTYSTFWNYTNGTEPKFSTGISILVLHARYCGADETIKRLSIKKDSLL